MSENVEDDRKTVLHLKTLCLMSGHGFTVQVTEVSMTLGLEGGAVRAGAAHQDRSKKDSLRKLC